MLILLELFGNFFEVINYFNVYYKISTPVVFCPYTKVYTRLIHSAWEPLKFATPFPIYDIL